jgi:predicted GIY-YIG superfamily endonuclease
MNKKVYTYGVYVIEIDGDRWTVYVGQTYLTPEERFRQHQEGIHSAPSLRNAVKLELRPDLYKHLPRLKTRLEAEKAERDLANRLKDLGYMVEGGH